MMMSGTADNAPEHRVRLRTARLAVAATFFVHGVALANWVARIPAIQEDLGLSAGALGIALLGGPVGLVLAAPITAWMVARFGSRPVTVAGWVALCSTLPLPALASNLAMLLLVLVALGSAVAAMDVAMNVQGVAVESGYGRPLMSSFHGLFSVGGLIGALTGALAASERIGPLPHLLAGGLALGATVLVVTPWLLPADAEGPGDSGPVFAWPSWALAGLAAVAFCVLLGEGAMADWSAVYLRRAVGTDPGLAAGGYAAFSLAMAFGRLTGDRINARFGPVALVRSGAILGALGLLGAVVIAQPAVTILGFACVGAGFSIILPITLSAAGRDRSMPTGSAVAAVTTAGYLGFLVGPPLIGFAAEFTALRWSLSIIALLCVTIVVLARTVLR
jgi:MFS family permease